MKAPCAGMQGKMLPSVTEEDNGDVLTVVNGEWSKASGGGGGSATNLVVEFTIDYDNDDEITADKTFAQIEAAWNAGQNIIGIFEGNVLPLTTVTPTESYIFDLVTGLSVGGAITGLTHFNFYYPSNGSIEFATGVHDF